MWRQNICTQLHVINISFKMFWRSTYLDSKIFGFRWPALLSLLLFFFTVKLTTTQTTTLWVQWLRMKSTDISFRRHPVLWWRMAVTVIKTARRVKPWRWRRRKKRWRTTCCMSLLRTSWPRVHTLLRSVAGLRVRTQTHESGSRLWKCVRSL